MLSQSSSSARVLASSSASTSAPVAPLAPRRGARRDVAALAFGPAGLALAAAAGAGYLLLEHLEHQERVAQEASNERPCPSCAAAAFEPCLCTRWSDGDTGCNGCSQTGYMRCRSCGGRGKAVPIKATINAGK